MVQLLRVTGLKVLPVWYEAGAVKYQFANTETLFIVQLLLMGQNSFLFLIELIILQMIQCPVCYDVIPFTGTDLLKQNDTWITLVLDLKPKKDPSLVWKLHLKAQHQGKGITEKANATLVLSHKDTNPCMN